MSDLIERLRDFGGHAVIDVDMGDACIEAADLIESQTAKIERLQAENKQLRAVADAAHSYVYSFEAGSLSFEESSFRALEKALAAQEKVTNEK